MILYTWKPQCPQATETSMAAHPMGVSVKPHETAWGPHRFFPDFNRWIATAIGKICLSLTLLLALSFGGIAPAKAAQGTESRADIQASTPAGPLTFDDSVRIAIHRSPYFRRSQSEIKIKRMDETDSRYMMIPAINFRTMYYVNRPSSLTINPQPYSLSFVSDSYNPVVSYLNLQAHKLATQAAIYAHLKTISSGLERLGDFYLELAALEDLATYQRESVRLSKENHTYAQHRSKIGTGSALELKVAQEELQLAQSEQDQIAHSQQRTLANLVNFLDLKANQKIVLDLNDAAKQVLGNFTPTTATLAQVKKSSNELKILDIQKKLQNYNVKLAVAKIFPTFKINAQTPDPLSNTDLRGFYVGLGVDVPVWDGFSRIRNVSRQKAILNQYKADTTTKEDEIEDAWRGTLGIIQETGVALKIAQSQEEVARLKDRQNEIRYQAGQVRLPVVLESRKNVLVAQKNTVRKKLEYNKAVLNLRRTSGDLSNSYVHATSWRD